jgi:hypothetical protein
MVQPLSYNHKTVQGLPESSGGVIAEFLESSSDDTFVVAAAAYARQRDGEGVCWGEDTLVPRCFCFEELGDGCVD